MKINGKITITGSKSETNRLLLLQALSDHAFEILNVSNSKDSQVMQAALTSKEEEVNIGIAGTAMRFLTAYFAVKEGRKTILTGIGRMLERPVGILVDALNELGAEITFVNKKGYPPLEIRGKKIEKNCIEIPADVSSQYVTALMLIAPFLEKGLTIHLKGKITSIPYIEMTQGLLQRVGVKCVFKGNQIKIIPSTILMETQTVESDWSSASYYYSLLAISDGGEIQLGSYREDSLQGDKELVTIYKNFGIESVFIENQVILKKKENVEQPDFIALDLNDTPDIAQTIAVTCTALKIKCKLTGLATLKIKETDRLEALKLELFKFGAQVITTNNSLEIKDFGEAQANIEVKTYHDHRMAMAFAPLKLYHDFTIEDRNVVEKSYPDFWNDFEKLGISFIDK
ncbi:3-phosphoshikimate 1-carboxyvinyltransferase [Flavobacteriaceae bacterium UJ101]|nr:3-phosphoshikimate 1-carboxyvinyltransferase [Flavobacteriaceae bacterium UJ101]